MEIDQVREAFRTLLEKDVTRPLDLCTRLHVDEFIEVAESEEELAQYIFDYLGKLYLAYDKALFRFMKKYFSEEVWRRLKVVIDPREVDGLGKLTCWTIVMTSSRKLSQSILDSATYYGNVELTITSGRAQIMDSKYTITAKGCAVVKVHGRTEVRADDKAVVYLYDQSSVVAYGHSEIHAKDESFVYARGCYPRIDAWDQSQVLLGKGSAFLELHDVARALLVCVEPLDQPIRAKVDGYGLLVLKGLYADDVLVSETSDFRSIKVDDLAEEDYWIMYNVAVPHYKGRYATTYRTIAFPLDVNQLKKDVARFLPDRGDKVYFSLFEQARNEQEVCEVVYHFMEAMLQKGLTGDFLRWHFTNETLLHNNIYVGVSELDYHTDKYFNKNKRLYCFGDRMLENFWLREYDVYALEHALVIVNNSFKGLRLGQYAKAIVLREYRVSASGRSRVLAKNQAHVDAMECACVVLMDKATCVAYNSSRVFAHGDSVVCGFDSTEVDLYDNSRAIRKGDCEVRQHIMPVDEPEPSDGPILDIEPTCSSIEQILDGQDDRELMMYRDNDNEVSVDEGLCALEDCLVDLDSEEICEDPNSCDALLSCEESASPEDETECEDLPVCDESFRQDDEEQESKLPCSGSIE